MKTGFEKVGVAEEKIGFICDWDGSGSGSGSENGNGEGGYESTIAGGL
jgi:hypothetical protein